MARLILTIISWYIGIGIGFTMIWLIIASMTLHECYNTSYWESLERVATYSKTSGLLVMTFLWPAVGFHAAKYVKEFCKKDVLEELKDIDEMAEDIYKNS